MKLPKLIGMAALAAAGLLCFSSAASADDISSDAAHMCLQGPQLAYYQVVTPEDTPFDVNYLGLAHGSDDFGTFVIAPNHGACESFVSENKKKGGGKGGKAPQQYIVITLTQVFITGPS